jgi:hypothetical protein
MQRSEAMLTLRVKPQTLFVENGRVMCPLRGDIDVESCFGCEWLRSMDLDGKEPQIACEVKRSLFAPRIPLRFEDSGF